MRNYKRFNTILLDNSIIPEVVARALDQSEFRSTAQATRYLDVDASTMNRIIKGKLSENRGISASLLGHILAGVGCDDILAVQLAAEARGKRKLARELRAFRKEIQNLLKT